MNSRTKAGPKSLARTNSKKFLMDLANVLDKPRAVERLKKRYPDLFSCTGAASLAQFWAANTEEDEYKEGRSDVELIRKYWLMPLRDTLQAIWRVKDVRAKQWGIFKIRQDYFSHDDPRFNNTPLPTYASYFKPKELGPPDFFERSFIQMIDHVHKTRICKNPDCDAPYYFATRNNQKYCHPECAKPSQREYKKSWWRRNGKAWRKARARNS
jgi:hypothetical protein